MFLAAISGLGVCGTIFNILKKVFKYIKNQYTQDKFYGLMLILISIGFIVIMSIFVIKPVIISFISLFYLNKMHEREFKKVKNKNAPVREETNRIIQLYMRDIVKRNFKHTNNEDELKNIFNRINNNGD